MSSAHNTESFPLPFAVWKTRIWVPKTNLIFSCISEATRSAHAGWRMKTRFPFWCWNTPALQWWRLIDPVTCGLRPTFQMKDRSRFAMHEELRNRCSAAPLAWPPEECCWGPMKPCPWWQRMVPTKVRPLIQGQQMSPKKKIASESGGSACPDEKEKCPQWESIHVSKSGQNIAGSSRRSTLTLR